MSLQFTTVTDIERDCTTLEIGRSNSYLLLLIEKTAEGEYVVESLPEGATFTLEEAALIVTRALKLVGLRVREPGE